MTQQDIAPDQSLNIILTKIASNWKLNLREINLDSNNHDYNSKKIAELMLNSSDTFKSATGNSFNIQKGSYVYTYDKNCKKLSERRL